MADKPKLPVDRPLGTLSRTDAMSILGDIGVQSCPKDPPAPVRVTGTIGPSPEETLWTRMTQAHYNSYTRMQYIENMTDATIGHGIRSSLDWASKTVRGFLPTKADGSAIADRSITDGLAQLAGGLAYFASLDMTIPGVKEARPGDRQIGAQVEASVQRFLENHGRPDVKGVDDIVMASGWKFTSGEVIYNGKKVHPTAAEPLEIKNMLAVFVKTAGKDGKPDTIEILDPSTKVEGLKELPKLVNAMIPPSVHRASLQHLKIQEAMPWSDLTRIGPKPDFKALEKEIQAMESPTDKRWRDLVGGTGYIGWQIIPAIVSGGATGAAKGVTQAATKVPVLAEKIEKVATVAKGIGAAAAPLAIGNTVGGVGAAGGQFGQSLYFSPKAIETLAGNIVDVLTDPKAITAQLARDKLNAGLFDKTFKEGSNAGQYYIPSLRDNESPWKRMGQALGGNISLYEKRNNPWEKWPLSPRQVEVPELKEALNADKRLQYAINTTMAKHVSGKPMTDQEIFVLRVGYKLGAEGVEPLEPAGKNSTETKLVYTAAERAETLTLVDQQIQARIRNKVVASLGTGLDLSKDPINGVTLDKKQSDKVFADTGIRIQKVTMDFLVDGQFSQNDVKAYLKHETSAYEKVLEAQRAADLAQAQSMAMAMAMSP